MTSTVDKIVKVLFLARNFKKFFCSNGVIYGIACNHKPIVNIMKVWDTNRMEVVDEFPFLCEISEVHWSAGLFGSSRIAVADNTSNIALIDPR